MYIAIKKKNTNITSGRNFTLKQQAFQSNSSDETRAANAEAF